MSPETYAKLRTYLPSKKFIILIGICAGAILLFLGISSIFSSKIHFGEKKAPVEANGTLADVITQDSNENGIADWEESLWGLDPKGDGDENKRIIDEKKTAAGIDVAAASATATPTDIFSRDLLSSILALQQSGTLTPQAVTKIGESIGQNLDEKRSTGPKYTLENMTVSANASGKVYTGGFINAYNTALRAGIETEFDIIATALEENGETTASLDKLGPIAEAYRNFAAAIVALNTPQAVAKDALAFANANAMMADALEKTQLLYSDVLTGMIGIHEYTEARVALDDSGVKLSKYFSP